MHGTEINYLSVYLVPEDHILDFHTFKKNNFLSLVSVWNNILHFSLQHFIKYGLHYIHSQFMTSESSSFYGGMWTTLFSSLKCLALPFYSFCNNFEYCILSAGSMPCDVFQSVSLDIPCVTAFALLHAGHLKRKFFEEEEGSDVNMDTSWVSWHRLSGKIVWRP